LQNHNHFHFTMDSAMVVNTPEAAVASAADMPTAAVADMPTAAVADTPTAAADTPTMAAPTVAVSDPNADYVFNCPHCHMLVQVPRDGLNCQIFRHGVLKSNSEAQVPPHASQAECEQLVAAGLIYGCGKPFIYRGGDAAEICGYI
jgi:hypothetical protein